MVQVTRMSAALPRFHVRFYDAEGTLLEVTVAVACSAAAYKHAAESAADRLGYVPEAEISSIH